MSVLWVLNPYCTRNMNGMMFCGPGDPNILLSGIRADGNSAGVGDVGGAHFVVAVDRWNLYDIRDDAPSRLQEVMAVAWLSWSPLALTCLADRAPFGLTNLLFAGYHRLQRALRRVPLTTTPLVTHCFAQLCLELGTRRVTF